MNTLLLAEGDRLSAYILHLATLKEQTEVRIIEDILDNQNNILVTAETELTAELAPSFKNIKTLKPIESSISIDNAMTADQLYQRFYDFAADYPDIQAVFDSEGLAFTLKLLLKSYDQEPLLIQRLTALACLLPHLFHKACFCTLIGLALAQELQMTPEATKSLFFASLLQDIGILHLHPSLGKKEKLSDPSEWMTLSHHILFGAQMLDQVENIPKQACIAVLEHHEKCDGTGYPAAKSLHELSDLGQMIALTCKLYDIRFKYFDHDLQTLNEALPILSLHKKTYKYKHYLAVYNLIRRVCIAKINQVAPNDIPAFTQALLEKIKRISIWYRLILDLEKIIPIMTDNIRVMLPRHMISNIKYIVKHSGILSECMVRWLEYISDVALDSGFREIEEANIMLTELSAQLSKANQQISFLLSDKKTVTLIASKTKRIAQIHEECIECELGNIPKAWEDQAKNIDQLLV